LRDELEGLERALALFLATSHGRFETFYAECERSGRPLPESMDA
jgi:hypothetical protein